MVTVKCVICGKEFESLKSTKKYCSKECENANRRLKYAKAKAEGLNPHNMGLKEKECLICNKKFTPKSKSANQRTCCYNCMPDGIQLKRGDFLAKIKHAHGGKCERCGYNTCVKALEFHHIDPSKKDFTISSDNFKLKEAIEESKKCILICANCHRELHDNMWQLEDLKNIEERDS